MPGLADRGMHLRDCDAHRRAHSTSAGGSPRPTSARLTSPVPQTAFPSPHSLSITVKEVGPLAEPAGLHGVVTLFDKTSRQAFIESVNEPDTRLSDFIAAVRDRGRFRAPGLAVLGKAAPGCQLLLRHRPVRPPTDMAMINTDASPAWR
ncbi:hypothetical protein [Streptomyces sp. NBC_01602]|uniref:hypothetical protein n=1 Tax=Streptomyces sp. NBC_01602 TaxID=2975893 RepID=UPI003866C490|nr:hypothetical protein OG955_00845 [Streptomyces sp. NBC_01602]